MLKPRGYFLRNAKSGASETSALFGGEFSVFAEDGEDVVCVGVIEIEFECSEFIAKVFDKVVDNRLRCPPHRADSHQQCFVFRSYVRCKATGCLVVLISWNRIRVVDHGLTSFGVYGFGCFVQRGKKYFQGGTWLENVVCFGAVN